MTRLGPAIVAIRSRLRIAAQQQRLEIATGVAQLVHQLIVKGDFHLAIVGQQRRILLQHALDLPAIVRRQPDRFAEPIELLDLLVVARELATDAQVFGAEMVRARVGSRDGVRGTAAAARWRLAIVGAAHAKLIERALDRAGEVVAHLLHLRGELEKTIDGAPIIGRVAEDIVDGRSPLEVKPGSGVERLRGGGGRRTTRQAARHHQQQSDETSRHVRAHYEGSPLSRPKKQRRRTWGVRIACCNRTAHGGVRSPSQPAMTTFCEM
jgi:hypothetical protein